MCQGFFIPRIYTIIREVISKKVGVYFMGKILDIDEALDKAQKYIEKLDFDKALPILEELVKKVEESEPYKDDEHTEYHSFHEKLEELLYEEFEWPFKEVCNIPEPLSDLYLAYGSALLGLKKKKKSKEALLTALRWNPAHSEIYMKLADWAVRYRDDEALHKYASDAMKWSFHKKILAIPTTTWADM